jgi:hypothetical protein
MMAPTVGVHAAEVVVQREECIQVIGAVCALPVGPCQAFPQCIAKRIASVEIRIGFAIKLAQREAVRMLALNFLNAVFVEHARWRILVRPDLLPLKFPPKDRLQKKQFAGACSRLTMPLRKNTHAPRLLYMEKRAKAPNPQLCQSVLLEKT